jgi:uncharacterized protein YlxW (UPF0749 family)
VAPRIPSYQTPNEYFNLFAGDLLAKREQYEAEKARTAELTQRLAVIEENVRFMAHQVEELRSSLDEARGKLEESVRKVAEKDAQLEERTQVARGLLFLSCLC